MKKLFYVPFFFLLLFAGCEKKALLPGHDPAQSVLFYGDASISEAKEWFTKNYSGKNNSLRPGEMKKDPVWELAIDHGHYLEVPLLYDGKKLGLTLRRGEGGEKTKQEAVCQVNLLLIKRGNEYKLFVDQIIPRDDFAKANKRLFKTGKLSARELSKIKFTGIILHYDWEGQLKGGAQYINGEGNGIIYPPTPDQKNKVDDNLLRWT